MVFINRFAFIDFLFNSISIFVGYLIPKLFLMKSISDAIDV